MMLASTTAIVVAIVGVVVVGGAAYLVTASRQRERRRALWRQVKNGMTPDEIRAVLGQPPRVIPIEDGETWDFGRRPHEASVSFTYGKVTGYIKPM